MHLKGFKIKLIKYNRYTKNSIVIRKFFNSKFQSFCKQIITFLIVYLIVFSL